MRTLLNKFGKQNCVIGVFKSIFSVNITNKKIIDCDNDSSGTNIEIFISFKNIVIVDKHS